MNAVNMLLNAYVKQSTGIDLSVLTTIPNFSLIADNIFENLYGEQASAIYLSYSVLYMTNSVLHKNEGEERIHFNNNLSPKGTTIYGFNSVVLMSGITMSRNKSSKGGCLYLVSSESVL